MPRVPPKRLHGLSGADTSPRKLRRSKEVENLNEIGRRPTSRSAESNNFSLQTMKNALPDTADVGKENGSELVESKFKDESTTVTLSGVENYFLQGKAPQLNKGRVKRVKGKAIPHQADSHLCEEESDDDEKTKDTDKKFIKCDLGLLRDYLSREDARAKSTELFKRITKDFRWWTYCLAGGFNILLYGVGTKRTLLEEFRRTQLSEFRTLAVDGFKEDVTTKSILSTIVDSMKLKGCEQKRSSMVEWAKKVASAIHRHKQQLIILLNNIDAPNLRDPSDQSVLAALAESPAILMVATVDHINASLLHTTQQLESFNWIYYRANTFAFSWQEILAGHSSLLGLNPKSNQSAHSLSSLDVLWQSLATNSRSIFRLFYAMYFDINEPVAFWDLFNAAKDDFLVSSDTALRQQLVEFSDHRILRWKRAEDGNEQLVGCLDRQLVEKFLAEKGLNLDII